MMREIKFRAWHEGYTQRLKPTKPQMLYEENLGDCLVWKEQGQPIIVMQFTGLFDKNGKEIYEGDILQRVGHNYEFIVKWYKDSCGFHLAWVSDSINAGWDVIIVGNIYENKT
jgi:hypothetical protein